MAGQPRPPWYPRRNGPTLRLKTSRRRPCRQAPICRRPRRISGLACRRWAGVECRHRPLTLIARSFDQSIGTPLNLFYSYSTYLPTGTTKITRFATQTGVPRICVRFGCVLYSTVILLPTAKIKRGIFSQTCVFFRCALLRKKGTKITPGQKVSLSLLGARVNGHDISKLKATVIQFE